MQLLRYDDLTGGLRDPPQCLLHAWRERHLRGPSGAPSSRPGDRRFSGLIGSTGLTCVVFQSDSGDRYALTGVGVTPEVRRIAASGQVAAEP